MLRFRIYQKLMGIVTFIPLLYFLAFLIFFCYLSTTSVIPGQEMFFTFFIVHGFIVALNLSLLVFYVKNVFRNQKLSEGEKIRWTILIFLGNIVAMPIYWYYYIWKTDAHPLAP